MNYAPFIWSSYAVAALILLALAAVSWRRARRLEAKAALLQDLPGARRRRRHEA